MREIIEKLISIEKEISKEKGSLALFALMLREDNPDRWDLLVSSPWFEKNEKKALFYSVQKLRSNLDFEEFILISRVVILRRENPVLNAIQNAIRVEHGSAEVKDCDFFGLKIKHAYIVTSKRLKYPIKSSK